MSRFKSDEKFCEWAAKRFIYRRIVRCPVCGGTEFKIQRSVIVDGQRHQPKKCKACSHIIVLVWIDDEFEDTSIDNPESGF